MNLKVDYSYCTRWDKNKINYIIKEHLGCEKDYIYDDLKNVYELINDIYYLIDKYNDLKEFCGLDLNSIDYVFECDFEVGRVSDDINENATCLEDTYNDIKVLENYNGIVVFAYKNHTILNLDDNIIV